MIFNSIEFLFFFPIFLAGYFATSGRTRISWMLVSSLLFYGWWDYARGASKFPNFFPFLFLLIVNVWGNYALALVIEKAERRIIRRTLLIATCIFNLGVLGFFKYFNFFAASIHDVFAAMGLNVGDHTLKIVLPIGISFYTFQAMSYALDVYKGEMKADRDPIRVLTFIVLFPQLVAGPIVRGSELLPQIRHDQKPTWEAMQTGMQLVLLGFFKKIVVADSSAPIVENIFTNYGLFTSLNVLLGVYLYAIQIYCDFSGYSDIAIGIGRMLGFRFPQNFNKPYFSASFSEFWTKWHMTLSRWLRDYLYIPLGGNRCGTVRTYVNLFITMLLGGLWHGANWTFVFWGFLHGMYLVLQRVLGPPFMRLMQTMRVPKPVVRIFLVVLVFHLTCLAWIFFRAGSFHDAWEIIVRIAQLDNLNPKALRRIQETARALGLGSFLLACELVALKFPITPILRRYPWLRVIGGAIMVVGILVLGNFAGQSFIYFQF